MKAKETVIGAGVAAVLVFLVGLAAWLNQRTSSGKTERLNILLITVDDMDYASLGVTGNLLRATPAIDKLASEGMLLTRAHVTVAICHPARNVWMTGRYPQNNGALGFEDIKPGVPTLLEALDSAGYFTGLLGKDQHTLPSKRWDMRVRGSLLSNGRSPGRYNAAARGFFMRARGKPFFLVANAGDPHRPFAKAAFSPDSVPVPAWLPDLPDIRRELAAYYTNVQRADQTVRAILRALDASGRSDRTVVLFMSDNGMPFPFAKTNVYPQSTRTPMIVRWPSVVSAGSVDSVHFVGGIDLAPTILEAVGLPNLAGADGRSFLPVLREQRQEGRDLLFTQIDKTSEGRSYPMRAVQDARYLYIRNSWVGREFKNESMAGLTFKAMSATPRALFFLRRTPEELYDLRRDPFALKNLADDSVFAETREHYRAILLEHLRNTNDPEAR